MFQLSQILEKSINDLICPIDFIKSKKKNTFVEYANVASCFDIEVSSFYNDNNEKCACMYAYVLGINGKEIIGRTWEQFLNEINIIVDKYQISNNRRFVIYVHNLEYEFQFIRKYFSWSEVFSLDLRRPIYARTVQGIEFRCSYILSNLSLQKVGDNLTKYKVSKLVGDLDYEKIRNCSTPLQNSEINYIKNDGLVVMAYIQELIESEGNINKIPLTNTGFVRNHFKSNCIIGKEKFEYRKIIKDLTMTAEQYVMLKQAFQGGFTHANMWNVNKTHKNVFSYDISSSYPTTLVAETFPMSKGYEIEITNDKMLDKAMNTFCCLFQVTFYNIDESFIFDNYISLSKCININDYEVNNGRVVCAKELTMIITELDYKIIKQTYKWDKAEFKYFTVFQRGYLPKDFVKTILELYETKTSLKGIPEKFAEYMRSKNQINASFGMCVTDPAKDDSIYKNNEWYSQKKDLQNEMNSYNNSWSRFLFYGWGVWCPAYARYNLWNAIVNLGEDYIYSDTDSVKGLNREKHIDFFNGYNKYIIDKLDKAIKYHGLREDLLHPKNNKGEEKPMGVWDYEGSYSMFKTLGAKRYMFSKNDELSITISGVNKEKGSNYLMRKYGNTESAFNAFTDGLVFPGEYLFKEINECGNEEEKCYNANGKMTHTYIDDIREGEVIDYMGKVCKFKELSAVHLEKCNYNMSISEIFKNYLQGAKESFII